MRLGFPAIACFSDLEFGEFNSLLLIAFCPARARARGQPPPFPPPLAGEG